MSNSLKILFFVTFIFSVRVQAQTGNSTCANAAPFCTGQTMQYPASTNAGAAQAGPYYGCLGSQPNPAWFFFQINSAGSMSITMSAQNDIDFICWGPFASMATACSNLTQGNMQSCSYSASNTETCTIANAVPGMFYLMLITNFSNSNQQITFNQSNSGQAGAASTNCGFVCVITPTNSGKVCAGSPVTLSLTANTSTAVNSYTWFGPNSYSSTSGYNVLNGLQTGGTYSIIASASAMVNGTPYTSTCQAVTNVSVVAYPQFSVSPGTHSICQGGTFTAGVVYTVATPPQPSSFNWQGTGGGVIWSPQGSTTMVTPALLPVTTTASAFVYSLTITPNALACPITQTMLLTIYNPLTPSITLSPPVCNNTQPFQMYASPTGGTWSISPNPGAISSGGFFSPTLAAIGNSTLYYNVAVGSCTVASYAPVEVSKFHPATLTGSLSNKCEQDPPFYLKNLCLDTATGYWTGPSVSPYNYFSFTGLSTGNYVLTYTSPSAPNPTVCPSFTTLTIPVFNPPTPTIAAIQDRCTNSPTIQLNATPTGGTWTANSGINSSGLQTPWQCPNGNSSVVYTAGQGTCNASTSRTLHVSQFVPATLTGTIPNLCVNNSPHNLISITQNTAGVWSGINVNNSAFNPGGLPTGVYTLTYTTFSIPNANLCKDSSTIKVSVLNPPTPSIQAVGPLCSIGNNIQMQVLPTNGRWLQSAFLNTVGIFNPSAAAIGANAVQYATGNSTCSIIQTIFVNVEKFEPATIIAGLGDLCVNNPAVSLMPFTANALGTWSGPGVTGNSFYPATAGAGNYKLIHATASSPSGLCPDFDTLAVKVYSLDAPTIVQPGTICNNAEPFQLKVNPLGGVFVSSNGGGLTTNGIFNPALGVIGKNLVSYSISAGPCIAYTQATITVEEFISAAIAKEPEFAYCVNHEPINMYGFVKNLGGTWVGQGMVGTDMFHPDKAKIGERTVLTYNTAPKNNPLLCPDVSTLAIYVKDLPKASIVSTSLSGCAPLQVNFSSPENTQGAGVWSIDDGSQTEGFKIQHVFTRAGTYNITYNYEDTEAPGCAVQVKTKNPVIVYPQPHADFEVPDDISMIDPIVKLINTSTPLQDNTYMWNIQGMEQYFDVHPTVKFPQYGTYRIVLQATDVKGCTNEVIKYLEVKNELACYIPNSFTPNYDGKNDVFMPVFSPYGLDTEYYFLQVFDRWGAEVFSTRDYKTGWNGTFQNKAFTTLKEDVYNYQLRYRDSEGRIYTRQGVVTLMR